MSTRTPEQAKPRVRQPLSRPRLPRPAPGAPDSERVPNRPPGRQRTREALGAARVSPQAEQRKAAGTPGPAIPVPGSGAAPHLHGVHPADVHVAVGDHEGPQLSATGGRHGEADEQQQKTHRGSAAQTGPAGSSNPGPAELPRPAPLRSGPASWLGRLHLGRAIAGPDRQSAASGSGYSEGTWDGSCPRGVLVAPMYSAGCEPQGNSSPARCLVLVPLELFC